MEENPNRPLEYDLALTGGLIVTMNASREIIPKGSILIKGGKIEQILTDEIPNTFNVKRAIDVAGKLLMPGLINAHTHSSLTLFRGVADDLPLSKWLNEYILPYEKKYIDPASVRLGTELAVCEMLLSGTTTFNEWYFFADEIASVANQYGVRVVVGEGITDLPNPKSKTPQQALEHSEYLVRKYKDNPLITVSIAPHSPYACSAQTLTDAKALAEKYGLLYHLHLAETLWERNDCLDRHSVTPVQYLERLGVLNERTVAAHCVHLDDADCDILINKQVGIIHNPECNMKLASGVAPIPELLKMGAKIGIGTDGAASNNNLDMFQEMRSAALLHKVTSNNPEVANARSLVAMATIEGARLLGLEEKTGSLELGKEADILIVDLNQPHLVPLYDVYSQIVYSLSGSDVESVLIRGVVVMEKRQVKSGDLEKVLRAARQFSESVRSSCPVTPARA